MGTEAPGAPLQCGVLGRPSPGPRERKGHTYLHGLLLLPMLEFPPPHDPRHPLSHWSVSCSLPPPASLSSASLTSIISWAISLAHPVPSSAPSRPHGESWPELRPRSPPFPRAGQGSQGAVPSVGCRHGAPWGPPRAQTDPGRRCSGRALSRADYKLALVTRALVRTQRVLGTTGWALLREDATTVAFQRSGDPPQQQRLGCSVEGRPGGQ